MSNSYVTVRSYLSGDFRVNVIRYDGTVETYGQHGYSHKRSARRAAESLARKLDVSYRQDLEYTDQPYSFIPVIA